jgi:hypothetical protein
MNITLENIRAVHVRQGEYCRHVDEMRRATDAD